MAEKKWELRMGQNNLRAAIRFLLKLGLSRQQIEQSVALYLDESVKRAS